MKTNIRMKQMGIQKSVNRKRIEKIVEHKINRLSIIMWQIMLLCFHMMSVCMTGGKYVNRLIHGVFL